MCLAGLVSLVCWCIWYNGTLLRVAQTAGVVSCLTSRLFVCLFVFRFVCLVGLEPLVGIGYLFGTMVGLEPLVEIFARYDGWFGAFG